MSRAPGPRKSAHAHLLGCRFDALTIEETTERVASAVAGGGIGQHAAVNVDVLVRMHRDPEYAALINACDVVSADGWPIVAASRLLGRPLPERVATPDLVDRLLERGDERGWKVFLLGARAHVVERAAAVVAARHPGLRIVGVRDGYWREDEEEGVARAVRDAAPDILLVATGSPRKERFIHRYKESMGVPFAMGVGGVFDILAGETRRAPRIFRRLGLEWFYRFLQEPRRMFRRYFIDDLYFLVLLGGAVIRRERET